jgi:hypothetical protein
VAELVILTGESAGRVFVLPDIPTVVGRSTEAHVQITDPWISSMHAMFERRGSDYWVVDLDSRNGTFLGEERIAEGHVEDGTVVRFGRTEVRVELRAGGAAPEAPEGARPRDPLRNTVRSDGTLAMRNPLAREREDDDPYALAPRPATVLRMAIDSVGIDALPRAPERLRAALDAAAHAAIDAGAVVTRLGGVGVLALFGLSGPSAEDAGRAIAAARAARRGVRAEGGLDLRAGARRERRGHGGLRARGARPHGGARRAPPRARVAGGDPGRTGRGREDRARARRDRPGGRHRGRGVPGDGRGLVTDGRAPRGLPFLHPVPFRQ